MQSTLSKCPGWNVGAIIIVIPTNKAQSHCALAHSRFACSSFRSDSFDATISDEMCRNNFSVQAMINKLICCMTMQGPSWGT